MILTIRCEGCSRPVASSSSDLNVYARQSVRAVGWLSEGGCGDGDAATRFAICFLSSSRDCNSAWYAAIREEMSISELSKKYGVHLLPAGVCMQTLRCIAILTLASAKVVIQAAPVNCYP